MAGGRLLSFEMNGSDNQSNPTYIVLRYIERRISRIFRHSFQKRFIFSRHKALNNEPLRAGSYEMALIPLYEAGVCDYRTRNYITWRKTWNHGISCQFNHEVNTQITEFWYCIISDDVAFGNRKITIRKTANRFFRNKRYGSFFFNREET